MKRKRGRGRGKHYLVSPSLSFSGPGLSLFSRQKDTDLILVKCENQKPYSLRQAGKGTFYFKLVEPAVLSGSIFLCSMPGSIFHCHFTCQGCVGVLSHQYLRTPSWPGCKSARCCEDGNSLETIPWAVETEMANPSSPVLLRICWWLMKLQAPCFYCVSDDQGTKEFPLSCVGVTCPLSCLPQDNWSFTEGQQIYFIKSKAKVLFNILFLDYFFVE